MTRRNRRILTLASILLVVLVAGGTVAYLAQDRSPRITPEEAKRALIKFNDENKEIGPNTDEYRNHRKVTSDTPVIDHGGSTVTIGNWLCDLRDRKCAISYGGGSIFNIEGHFATVDGKATVILDRTTWAHK